MSLAKMSDLVLICNSCGEKLDEYAAYQHQCNLAPLRQNIAALQKQVAALSEEIEFLKKEVWKAHWSPAK